jgi:hypothetical protein
VKEKFVVGKRRGDLAIKVWLQGVHVDHGNAEITLKQDVGAVEERLAKIVVEKMPKLRMSVSVGKPLERQVDELIRQSFGQMISEMKSQSTRTRNHPTVEPSDTEAETPNVDKYVSIKNGFVMIIGSTGFDAVAQALLAGTVDFKQLGAAVSGAVFAYLLTQYGKFIGLWGQK